MDSIAARTEAKIQFPHAHGAVQRRGPRASMALIAAFVSACTFGCAPQAKPPTAEPAANPASVATEDPRDLLKEVLAVYRKAISYQDKGKLSWHYLDGQLWNMSESPLSTIFVRPNKLLLRARGLQVTCDGVEFKARIEDPGTANYDGQILVRKSPPKLVLNDLVGDLEMKRFISDEVVDATPWPLLLLLGDAKSDQLLLAKLTFLPDETLGEQTYRRVQVVGVGPNMIWWIQPETLVVRRIELGDPDASFGVKGFVADFVDAQLNATIPESEFRFTTPLVSKRVQFFVLPPPTMDLPSPLFGKVVEPFVLTGADGKEIRSQDLDGKTVVLVWYLDRPESHLSLAQLQRTFQNWKDKEGVVFYAVSPEGANVDSKTLEAQLAKIGVDVPLARDLKAAGRDVFGIPGAPTFVVIDGQRRMQLFKAGADPELGQQLPLLLEEIARGGNPAGKVREMIAEEKERYRQQLAAASVDTGSTVVELEAPTLAPAALPRRLKLTKLWTSNELKTPGNILVVNDNPEAPRILICDQSEDWRTVAEFDAAGKLVARHELPIPETAAVALLRSAVNTQGKRVYVGSSRLAKQVFVFDENFKLLLAYPEASQKHDGIGDFALVDFKSDGELTLCVGFWGVLGVHGVELTGEQLWTNRAATPVVSLAVGPANEAGWRQLLATSDRGDIVAINAFGKNDPPVQVDGHAVTQLFAASFPRPRHSSLMGVALASDASQIALALDANLKALWDVPLPKGGHRNQIQWITSGSLLDGDHGDWVFAGPDGSIGIVASNASFFDMFATGQELTGVAVTKLNGRGVLLVASTKGIVAWEVAQVQGPQE